MDVVLGSHPHVIGPLAWVEGASGNRTLVAYSLGNFLSNHDAPAPLNELEGMLSCTFVKDANGVRVEDAAWTPLVNHCEEGAWGVYALGDYTPDLAARHAWLGGLGRSYRLARRHQPHGGQQPGRRLPRGRHANIARDGPLRRDADAPTTRRMAKVAPETRSARTPSQRSAPKAQSTIEKLPDLAVRRIAEERARQPSRTRAVC